MPTLIVHPRRGLYQITKCRNCGFTFECENCTAKLVSYRSTSSIMELLCHQCQSYYQFPKHCPNCLSREIISRYGGIDKLEEILKENFNRPILRIEEKTPASGYEQDAIFLTTRIFDPSIPYPRFQEIIFIQAENLLASPDYLVQEEVFKALSEVFLQLNEQNTVIFDTKVPELEFFHNLRTLNASHENHQSIYAWFHDFLVKETSNRQQFGFPPFKNLLLLTSQEKTAEKALQTVEAARNYLLKSMKELPDLQLSPVYQAKFLKRKGMYSFHLLIKFPRRYPHFLALQKTILGLSQLYRLQVRLNPRHIF